MVNPDVFISSVAHLLKCLLPVFHRSQQWLIAAFSSPSSEKLKSPAMMVISISLFSSYISCSCSMRYIGDGELSRCTQLIATVKVDSTFGWRNDMTAVRTFLSISELVNDFLQNLQGYLERMTVSYQCILVIERQYSCPFSSCFKDCSKAFMNLEQTYCRQTKSALASLIILRRAGQRLCVLFSQNQTLQVRAVICVGLANIYFIMPMPNLLPEGHCSAYTYNSAATNSFSSPLIPSHSRSPVFPGCGLNGSEQFLYIFS